MKNLILCLSTFIFVLIAIAINAKEDNQNIETVLFECFCSEENCTKEETPIRGLW